MHYTRLEPIADVEAEPVWRAHVTSCHDTALDVPGDAARAVGEEMPDAADYRLGARRFVIATNADHVVWTWVVG